MFRVPFQILLCLVFLYQILGWRLALSYSPAMQVLCDSTQTLRSSFVGLTSMVALMPPAGYVGKKMQDAQVSQMKMVRCDIYTHSCKLGTDGGILSLFLLRRTPEYRKYRKVSIGSPARLSLTVRQSSMFFE